MRLVDSAFLCVGSLPPLEFAFQHNTSLPGCLSALLGVEVSMDTWEVASLPLSLGGLGLLNAQRIRFAANWASWNDSLAMIQRRQSDIVATIVRAFRVHNPGSHVEQLRLVRIWWTQGSLPRLGKSLRGGSAPIPLSMMTILQPRNMGGSSWRRNQ